MTIERRAVNDQAAAVDDRNLWDDALTAHRTGNTARRDEALHALLTLYWKPCYISLRRSGASVEEAGSRVRDLIDDLLDHGPRRVASAPIHSLRAYLWARLEYQRRTLGRPTGTGNDEAAPAYLAEAEEDAASVDDHPSLEAAFTREWCLIVLERAIQAIQRTFVREGRSEVFEAIKHFLQHGPRRPEEWERLCIALGQSRADAERAVAALRFQYVQLVEAEVQRTVPRDCDFHDELRALAAAWKSEPGYEGKVPMSGAEP